MKMTKLVRGSFAEFIGTFALVFFGAGSIILTQEALGGAGSLVTVALAHGLVLTVFVSACMYVSGAQFNPAVSVGVVIAGKQDVKTAAAYIASQLVAAACAAGLLLFLVGEDLARNESVKLGATLGRFSSGEHANPVGVVGLEIIQTFALMFCILAAVVDERAHKLGGFCVGLTVATGILAFGPLTGSSMNPARSFGPALYGYWDMHWAYWVAPMIGACLAAGVYRYVWIERATGKVPPLHEGDSIERG
jgi:MIP family channel proteins